MVSMKKKRVRATEHFEEGSFKEGSKQKSITEEEKERLVNFASSSASSVSDSAFLREAMSRGALNAAPSSAPADDAADKSTASAGLAGPAAHTSWNKKMEPLRKQLDLSCDAMRAAEKSFEDLDPDVRATNFKEMLSYYKMCAVRLHMAKYATSRRVLPENMPVPTLDAKELLPVPGTSVPSPTTPAPSPQKSTAESTPTKSADGSGGA